MPAFARLTGVGTAVPDTTYTQEHLLDAFAITDPRVRSLFRNSAIDRRGLSLPPVRPDGTRAVESQGELLRKHRLRGLALGRAAIEACLRDAGATPADVRHLCCVTSTGFLTPGFSALLLRDLGIDTTCSRLDVVGMGCNAGLNALGSVAGWARTHPGELALMVCVEVCSAAYVFDGTLRSAVVNSLFGDGAAAVAVTAPTAGRPAPEGPALLRFSSRTIPEAVDAMRYDWDEDHGKFSFALDPLVPYVVGAHAEEALDRLLRHSGVPRPASGTGSCTPAARRSSTPYASTSASPATTSATPPGCCATTETSPAAPSSSPTSGWQPRTGPDRGTTASS